MNKRMLYKTLVIGVMVIFIGIGVQPAFAVTRDTTDSEDDCDLCPSIEDVVDSKEIEKYKEMSETISTLKDLKMDRPICEFLEDAFNKYYELMILAEDEGRIFLWIYACIIASFFAFSYMMACYEH
jgi:hypothetical protein